MLKFQLKAAPYTSRVFVIICPYADAIKYFQRSYKATVEDFSSCSGIHVRLERDGFIDYIIWLDAFDYSCRQYGTLAHELLHLVFALLQDRGIRYCSESEEAFTYLHGNLLEQFLSKSINKIKTKVNTATEPL